jgi:two-component system sensor histidine kinase UhpB
MRPHGFPLFRKVSVQGSGLRHPARVRHQGPKMSLHSQVFLSVILALALGLSALGALGCRQARMSVDHEMCKALDAAGSIVGNALLSLPGKDPHIYLARLVSSFDGNRHVHVRLVEDGRTTATSRSAPAEEAPAWFVRLLDIPAKTRLERSRLPGRQLFLTSDPHNEISESWLQFRDGAMILGLFSLLLLGLLHVVMARVTLLLQRLMAGFETIGGGDYGARVALKGPRDFFLLENAFNRMAKRLDLLAGATRRLSSQMQAIQEEERADLARDLHDEMGPFLFAMRVEADAIVRQTREPDVAARARAIGEAITHIQAQVRAILRQLRPPELTETGLSAAIGNLVTFFRRRHDAIAIFLDIAIADEIVSPEIGAAIYRVVQEALTNAARHSGGAHVWIAIAGAAGEITVTVDDDGHGFRAGKGGMGLTGMRERLHALSGRLDLSARPGGGTRLHAVIPVQPMAVPA